MDEVAGEKAKDVEPSDDNADGEKLLVEAGDIWVLEEEISKRSWRLAVRGIGTGIAGAFPFPFELEDEGVPMLISPGGKGPSWEGMVAALPKGIAALVAHGEAAYAT